MDTWAEYLAVGLGEYRRALLAEPIPLSAILKRLTKGNPPHHVIRDGGRPEWTLTPADRDALDLFFNGVGGYRAAYARGIVYGRAANEEAIAFLGNWLRDAEGLLGSNSKVWIPEDKRSNEALRTGNIIARELVLPRWLTAAEDLVSVDTLRGPRYKAAAGILAPRPERLKVKGEWPCGTAPRKPAETRERDIHEYGYS